jgi:hypothetical protein
MKSLYPIIASVPFLSCSPRVTPEQAIATAYRYTQVEWMPEERHILHGPDSRGIPVQTPDTGLRSKGGWWKPGVPAKSMPYQWGGFDTPEMFLSKIAAGRKAGDIADPVKRQFGDAATSSDACGIDCSGFISRCWNLTSPYSTAELPGICAPLKTWFHLSAGDILLNDKHVVLFVRWKTFGKEFAAYEAGPRPVWQVNACGLLVDKMIDHGYTPWRYRGMDPGNAQAPD